MQITRRDFLKQGGSALLLAALAGPLGLFDWKKALAADIVPTDNVLVVIQLSGGNDGLNTVIPHSIGAYYDNRPTLAYQASEVLPLTDQLGLHPSLKGIKSLWDAKKVAIVQGAGYDNPSRSHFRAQDIWQTAVPDRIDTTTGWLGRYHDLLLSTAPNPLSGLTIGGGSKIYLAAKADVPMIENVANFKLMLNNLAQGEKDRRNAAMTGMYAPGYDPATLGAVRSRGNTALQSSGKIQASVSGTLGVGYPAGSLLGEHLQLIAQLIGSGLGTRTFFTQTGDFDDHAQERADHAALLAEVDGSITAFYNDLVYRGLSEKVTILVYSEFGRRVKENGSAGTDHGAAAPVFVIGRKVRGGLIGDHPSLTSLDANGDLKYAVDFRTIYGTLLDKWLNMPHQDVLGSTYQTLPLYWV